MGRASLETLASGLGLVGNSGPMFRFVDPPLSVHYADVGDLNAVLPPSAARQRLEPSTLPAGVGVASEPAIARSLALAEALERYCAHAWSVEQFLTAPASALEEEHLDPRRLPRCSEQECDHPLCGWRPADPDLPIRWVKGVSLMTGRTVWLPARAVYLGLEAWPGERFVFANSSGCAAHPSLTRAIVAGLCELVERDAVALTWLQRLAVPRIMFDAMSDWLRPYVVRRSDAFFERQFFDATTDLGVPTVYGVEVALGHPTASTLVACATHLDPERAVAKVVCDLASHRPAVELERPVPDDPWTFTKAFQGCSFMARPENQEAFAFLLDSSRARPMSEMSRGPLDDERAELAWLLARLSKGGMDAFVADLSTDEARAAGVFVVRVVVPELMPVSFRLPARYLAHPRLFGAPAALGQPVFGETEVNPWPQPFG